MYLKFFILGCGIFLLVLGAVYNFKNSPPIIHAFTYGCVLNTPDVFASEGVFYWSEDVCYYYGSKSVVVSCIVGAGAFLTFSGLKNLGSDRRITMRTFVIPAIFGVIILIMWFAVEIPVELFLE